MTHDNNNEYNEFEDIFAEAERSLTTSTAPDSTGAVEDESKGTMAQAVVKKKKKPATSSSPKKPKEKDNKVDPSKLEDLPTFTGEDVSDAPDEGDKPVDVPQHEPKQTIIAKASFRKNDKALEAEATHTETAPLSNAINASQSVDDPDNPMNMINKSYPAKVNQSFAETLERREEIEAASIKETGRFIEGVDNARPGKTFDGRQSNDLSATTPMSYANLESSIPEDMFVPAKTAQEGEHGDGPVRSNGEVITAMILDTGKGAQRPREPLDDTPETGNLNPNDPASESFITCVNKNCAYREGCMRYRLSNKRNNKGVFFPETCRLEGVYISVDEYYQTDSPNLTLTPMDVMESTDTPSF